MKAGRIAMLALTLTMSCASRSVAPGSPGVTATCPPGAALAKNRCECRADLRLLLGACVSPRLAAERCGPTATPTASGGCVRHPPCEKGRGRDLVSGECVARREVRALATAQGILVTEEDLVGCSSERELVVGAPDPRGARRLACIRPAVPAQAQCPAGSILEEQAPNHCVRVIDRELHVDVARWLHGVIGAEGRAAAPPLCDALPVLGPSAPARLTVSLAFPDNDVTQVVAEVTGGDAATTAELGRTVRPMIEALRSLGGVATQSAVQTAVTLSCGVATERPTASPQTEDLEAPR